MSLGKNYLSTCKGQTIKFKVVDWNEDLKVKFVDYCEDFSVEVRDGFWSTTDETIKIKVVNFGEDVKLRKVRCNGDIRAIFE